MKNNIKIIILFIVFTVSVIMIFEIRQTKMDREIYVQQKLEESYEYLSEKYGEELKVELLNYSMTDGFRANYCLLNFPNIRFRVDYWVDKGQYCDNYLQQTLTNEMKQILNDMLSELELSNINVDVGMMVGPPFDLTNRLFEYFKKLGRIPRISDIKDKELFLYVIINSNDQLDDDVKKAIQ